MTRIQEFNNQEFLRELRERVNSQNLRTEEIFLALENPNQPETITKFKKLDYSKMTSED
jgi:hypothetical protein